jgi:hypothetical protein
VNHSPKTIEILINPTGEATVHTKGFAGSSCREASRFIEQALGESTGEQLTSEFHQVVVQQEHAGQKN